MAQELTCLSCSAPLHGTYCARCGARRGEPLSFRRVLADFGRHVTELDFAFVRTVVELSWRPGSVVRAYVRGERRRYTNPLKYAFVTATVHVLVFNWLDLDVTWSEGHMSDPRAADTLNTTHGFLGYLLFLLMLPGAVVQRLLFRRAGFNVAECYVFLAFVYGHYMWAGTLYALLDVHASTVGVAVSQAIETVYVIWAAVGFYESRSAATIARAFALRLAVGAIFLGAAAVAVRLLAGDAG